MTYPPPLFTAGQIVDMRYRTKIAGIKVGMPDRCYIEMIYRKPRSTTWMLRVLSESRNGTYYMTQDQLFKNQTNHSADVYKLPDVQKMLELGYRFVKNMRKLKDTNQDAMMLITGLRNIKEIDEIVTMEGRFPNGNPTGDDIVGIWVKYKTVIPVNHEEVPNYVSMYKAK